VRVCAHRALRACAYLRFDTLHVFSLARQRKTDVKISRRQNNAARHNNVSSGGAGAGDGNRASGDGGGAEKTSASFSRDAAQRTVAPLASTSACAMVIEASSASAHGVLLRIAGLSFMGGMDAGWAPRFSWYAAPRGDIASARFAALVKWARFIWRRGVTQKAT